MEREGRDDRDDREGGGKAAVSFAGAARGMRSAKRRGLYFSQVEEIMFFMEFRMKDKLDEKSESNIKEIIGAAIEVHRELGPGYLEKVYEQAMMIELHHRGLPFETQVPIDVVYKGTKIHGHLLDMVVDGGIILEFKSVEALTPVHEAQILSYLKSTRLPVGLLINFKEKWVKNGIKRFVRTHPSTCG